MGEVKELVSKSGRVFKTELLGSVPANGEIKGRPIVRRNGDVYEVIISRFSHFTPEKKAEVEARRSKLEADRKLRREARLKRREAKVKFLAERREERKRKTEERLARLKVEQAEKIRRAEERLARLKSEQ